MASNQPIRAVEVRKSDNINIPQPGSYISGTNSAGGLGGTAIIDLNANFLGVSNPGNTGFSNKVAVGDIVYVDDVLGAQVIGLVSQVTSNTEIQVGGVLASGTSAYKIYRSNGNYGGSFSAQSKTGIEGYSLYVGGGGSGNLSVIPAGSEDTVLLKGVAAGSFIPLQVVRVNSTGTDVTDILALE